MCCDFNKQQIRHFLNYKKRQITLDKLQLSLMTILTVLSQKTLTIHKM